MPYHVQGITQLTSGNGMRRTKSKRCAVAYMHAHLVDTAVRGVHDEIGPLGSTKGGMAGLAPLDPPLISNTLLILLANMTIPNNNNNNNNN